MLCKAQKELRTFASHEKAKDLSRFFKTDKGNYGEGDKFLGVTVPIIRKIAKNYLSINLNSILSILSSAYHEERFLALVLLERKYSQANKIEKQKIFEIYLSKKKHINSWDLVDTSAAKIVGHFLFKKRKHVLYQLAKSNDLWSRRIAIVSTHYFIKQGLLTDTFRLSKILLQDKEDLIHKACGWMLREAGKKDITSLEKFLEENIKNIQRMTLRYAIEKMHSTKRKYFLNL